MGGGIVVIIWAIILAPFVFLLGLLLDHMAAVLYHRIRKTLMGNRKRGCLLRIAIASLFTIAVVPLLCCLGVWLAYKDRDDYWEYTGAFDYFRMPLEEPYQLTMVDSLVQASIGKWKDESGSSIVWGIRRYEKRGPLVAGYFDKRFWEGEEKDDGWFLFDCNTGTAREFRSEKDLIKACEERGFDPPLKMLSIQDNSRRYWSDPNRRRK